MPEGEWTKLSARAPIAMPIPLFTDTDCPLEQRSVSWHLPLARKGFAERDLSMAFEVARSEGALTHEWIKLMQCDFVDSDRSVRATWNHEALAKYGVDGKPDLPRQTARS